MSAPVASVSLGPEVREDLSLDEQLVEFARCMDAFEGYLYWCKHYCYILEEVSRRPVLYHPWPHQQRFAELLHEGLWPVGVKARRVGWSTAYLTYDLWSIVFGRGVVVEIFAQSREYAAEYIGRIRYSWQFLPSWMRPQLTNNHVYGLGWNADEKGCRVMARAATKGATRGPSTTRVRYDEAAYMLWFREALRGSEPAIESAGGSVAVLSTAAGPFGDYHDTWRDAVTNPDSRFVPMFSPWQDRPGRDWSWYVRMREEHKADPDFMPREYPSNPEEAFTSAAGRVYPQFKETTHAKRLETKATDGWRFYRAIDFGTSAHHALVCLWIAHNPDKPMGLTVDPDCNATIYEFLVYHYPKPATERSRPRDNPDTAYDHSMDGLRYAVVTFPDLQRGHVHIYREIHVYDAAARGWTPNGFAEAMRDMTPPNELIQGTVCDRSNVFAMIGLNDNGIECGGHTRLPLTTQTTEVRQGIELVSNLVAASPWWVEPADPLAAKVEAILEGRKTDVAAYGPKTDQELFEAMMAQMRARKEAGLDGGDEDEEELTPAEIAEQVGYTE